MPRKPFHDVLIFKKTAWLSTYFDTPGGKKHWRTYWRPKGKGEWWMGLLPKGYVTHMKDVDLPQPILKAYAFTEWTWDTPKRPNGADLWVQDTAPNAWQIWYSAQNWDTVLESTTSWSYVGVNTWDV